ALTRLRSSVSSASGKPTWNGRIAFSAPLACCALSVMAMLLHPADQTSVVPGTTLICRLAFRVALAACGSNPGEPLVDTLASGTRLTSVTTAAPSGEFLHILVGYDGSPPASRALDAAVDLLRGRT